MGGGGSRLNWRRLSSDDVFRGVSARYRAVVPSSGSNVIPRRARPGPAGLGPHTRFVPGRGRDRARVYRETRGLGNRVESGECQVEMPDA